MTDKEDDGLGEMREAAHRLSLEGYLERQGLTLEDAEGLLLPGDFGDGIPIGDEEDDQ